MNNSNSSLVIFKAISDFVNELDETFPDEKFHSIKLYKRLLEKTTIVHTKPIENHVKAVKIFCKKNRNAIVNKDQNNLQLKKIIYSKRVFIDIQQLLESSDKETQHVIWQHLLCLSALVDPASDAKNVLKDSFKNGYISPGENDFLTNMVDKIENNIDPNAGPLGAMSGLLNSGIVNDLVGSMNSGISNGSLDIGNLVNAVSGLVGNLSNELDTNPELKQTMGMVTNLVSNLGQNLNNGDNGNQLDLGKMLQTLTNNLAQNTNNMNNQSLVTNESNNNDTVSLTEQSLPQPNNDTVSLTEQSLPQHNNDTVSLTEQSLPQPNNDTVSLTEQSLHQSDQ